MLSDIRNHYGLIREISSISQIAYFETTQLQQVVTELKLAIKDSKLIVCNIVMSCFSKVEMSYPV